MPSNAVYLQAAYIIVILSFAAYLGYAVMRLRQAQEELRGLQHQQDQSAASKPAHAGDGDPAARPSAVREPS